MATTTAAAPKKRRIGKIVAIILGVLIIPIIVGYFIATSEMFFKRVILPQVGKSMNSTVTVTDASIRPFSQVVLKNLEVTPVGKETLLKAEEIRARYSLADIIKGKLTVHEVTVVSPVITLVENADGSSNLDPVTKTDETSAPEKDGKKSDEPPNLNIKNVSLKNATVRRTKVSEDGSRDFTEIANLNFTLDQLINGQTGKIIVSADVRSDVTPSANSTNVAASSLRGKLDGAFDFKLTADVQPEFAKGNLRFDVSEASGEMADLALAKLSAVVNCDISPTEIRQLSLNFAQAGQPLGNVAASGPFSFETSEGKLNVKVSSIDRRVLNLVGAQSGFDFNKTAINANTDLVFTKNGNSISIEGQLSAKDFSATKTDTKETTPILNFQTTYQIAVDQTAESAVVQKFDLSGTQNGQPILRGSITRPIPISWGGDAGAPEEAALQLTLTNFNLADWKPFVGDTAQSGIVNANLNLLSQQGGKQLAVDLISSIQNLSATIDSNRVENATVDVRAKTTIAEMKEVTIQEFVTTLSQNSQTALTVNASGSLNLENDNADLKTSVDGTLAPLFKIVQVPDLNATAGTLNFTGQITQKGEAQTLVGNFALANFSGVYAGSPLDKFGARFDADLAINQSKTTIRKLSGELQQAGKPGGTFDVKGDLNSVSGAGNFELKLVGLNENALRPFLASSLGEKQLVTIAVDADLRAILQERSSSVKGNVDLKNFVVRDPKKAQADAPLSAQLRLDGEKRDDVFDLKQFQAGLSPTQRAKNQLNVTGQLDLSKTNAIKGNLLVQSDSFDITPFYDLYNPPTETASAPTPAPQPGAPSNEEPDPIELPVESIRAEINIGQFYLREIEIKDWRGVAKVERNHLILDPLQLSLNGAPIKVLADVNLGVKGWAYDLSASLDKVPLEPLANSFMPEKRGAYKGTILADAKIKGAGMTGVNLRERLNGHASFTFTNANIQIVSERWRPALVTIATVLRTPEIAQSPLNWVDARVGFGNGNIAASNLVVVSEAFRATVQGAVPIADVLTNSPIRKIPVNFELRRSLAERTPKELNLMSGTTSPDGKYVLLPTIFVLKGTLGKVDVDYDLKPLAIRAGVGLIGGEAGKILGGILGQPAQTNTNTTNNATTNAPAATNAPINQLLEGLLNRKKK